MEMMPRKVTGVTSTTVGEELLLFNPFINEAHNLNRSAAFVYDLCEPDVSVEDARRQVYRELGIDDPEFVQATVEYLAHKKLVVASSNAWSRRDFIARWGTLAASVPVVLTMTAPQPASATSVGCVDDGSGSTTDCQGQGAGDPPTRCCTCGNTDAGSMANFGCTDNATCDAGTCFCMTEYFCNPGGPDFGDCTVGSCGGDAGSGTPQCVLDGFSGSARCVMSTSFGSTCQQDCSMARQAAGEAMASCYACCTNCT